MSNKRSSPTTPDNKALNAISLETKVLAKSSEGYGSLDEEALVVRYAAMRIARIYVRHLSYVVTST